MIQKFDKFKENRKILITNARKSKFRKPYLSKYGCHGKVLGQDMSYQIIAK